MPWSAGATQGSALAAGVQRGLNPGRPDAAPSKAAQLHLNMGSAVLNLARTDPRNARASPALLMVVGGVGAKGRVGLEPEADQALK